MEFSQDEGVNPTIGEKEEFILVKHLKLMKHVWIFCWDFSAIEKKRAAHFGEGDIRVTVEQDEQEIFVVEFDQFENEANICCVAAVINKPDGLKLYKCNWEILLKRLQTAAPLKQLIRRRGKEVGVTWDEPLSVWDKLYIVVPQVLEKLLSVVVKQIKG